MVINLEQKEFLEVVTVKEAKERLYSNFRVRQEIEEVDLKEALGRVVAEDIVAQIDVPPFDRASMDGYALQASDTFYADEENPVKLELSGYIGAGSGSKITIKKGKCAGIATGAPIPKGANAVAMVEYADRIEEKGMTKVRIYRPVAPGENIMAAGADIMQGETVIRKGVLVTPRESGTLAALGLTRVPVYKKARVGIISTGDEIVEPGAKLDFGKVYDVNARAVADAVIENGGDAEFLGIVKDDPEALLAKLGAIIKGDYDIIITSGGTSAGVGDLLYKIVDELGKPGTIVHGIAVKPGKPTAIAVVENKPVFCLPGYPTSAMIIFDIFVAPIIREISGLGEVKKKVIKAKSAMRLYSAKGRHEYMLMNLVKGANNIFSAYPILTGSGAITTLARADGYVEIPEGKEMIGEKSEMEVILLSDEIRPADLSIIGSHCIGVDTLLMVINRHYHVRAKIIHAGSSGGLAAVRRGESDISGTHLIDERTGEYNIPFLRRLKIADRAYLVRGYDREQGLVISKRNQKGIKDIEDLLREDVTFINRNAGSGTRVLLDMELGKIARVGGMDLNDLVKGINGYEVEAKSHSAVAAAVAYGRADVGLAIKTVAEQYDLGFIPVREEKYDFAIPKDRMDKPMVKRFLHFLSSDEFKKELEMTLGLNINEETGRVIHSPENR